MNDQWYIAREGQTFGPYTPDQLHEFRQTHPLLPTDHVLRAGTQEWLPAQTMEALLFPPAPPPEPEPAPSPSFVEEEPIAAPRSRRKAESALSMPLWFWLGPIGGAAVLGLLTVVIMFTGRNKPPPPREERRTPVVRRPAVEKPLVPHVEVPPPPTDYSISKVDYTTGQDGAKVMLVQETVEWRREGYVNGKGTMVYHGKSEAFYPDAKEKKSETWYANGVKYGPAITWDEDGIKTTEGQHFLDTRQGKWTTFRKDGSVALEELWYRGKKLGPSTTFHANGKKARTVLYKNDRRTGPAVAWDETGKALTADESLRADLVAVNYDDMIDILGPPTELHEATKARGSLHIWAMPGDRYIAVWVEQDPDGQSTKRDVRAFQVPREALDELKRGVR